MSTHNGKRSWAVLTLGGLAVFALGLLISVSVTSGKMGERLENTRMEVEKKVDKELYLNQQENLDRRLENIENTLNDIWARLQQ